MSDHITDNSNELPFKLRFTSTQKMTKELIQLIDDRRQVLDKLYDEYDLIGQHKSVIANIKSSLETCHQCLKDLRALCQCQSDDDRTAANQQLANTEEALEKLRDKLDKMQLIKCIDVAVARLPSNWRAAMLRIQKEKQRQRQREELKATEDALRAENGEEGLVADGQMKDVTNEEMQRKADDNNDTPMASEDEISHQFEKDLERKIYETQVEELMQLIQGLVMKTKTMRARIDISKQLIKVVLRYKRELEQSNSKLKESMATCHCAEAGAPDDQEFQTRMEEKKRLESEVARLSADLKYWEEQYSILKEGRHNKNKENEAKQEVIVVSDANAHHMTTTVVEVANEEEVAHDYTQQMAHTSSSAAALQQQTSCMFAGQSQPHQPTAAAIHSVHSQGTANPAVIYLEGLVANQQPTYIPANTLHHQLGVYPHAYALAQHAAHPYAHQAPDGSIQVYSTDITGHPGYIAYQ